MMIEKSSYSSSSSSLEKQPSSREQKRSSIETFQPVVGNNVQQQLEAEMPEVSFSLGAIRKPVSTWMAFEDDTKCNMKTPNGKSFQGRENYDCNASNGVSSDILNSSDDGDRSGNSSQRFVRDSAMTSGQSCYDSDSGKFSRVSQELKDALAALQQTFVVCDASKPDCPIVYASSGFFTASGYPSEEVIGKNWGFLQGPETDQTEVIKIRAALKNGRSYSGKLLNYKKDGTPFWNLLTISPIKHHNNPSTLYFVGMQVVVCEYNEGVDDEDLISNRLPGLMIESNEEEALHSNELIQTEKHPSFHVWYTTQVVKEEMEKFNLDFVLPESAELKSMSTPGGGVTKFGSEREMSSTPETSKKDKKSVQISSWSLKKPMSSLWKPGQPSIEPEVLMTKRIEKSDIWDPLERERYILQGINLACTLELIKRNFVIADSRLPDSPIIYASNNFLKLTEYTRKEVLGRNCRFLQGPQTDQAAVAEIRDAIKEQREITVQLINYTKSGKKFWNLFHLQPTYDQKGRLQYFIGVQIDGNDHAALHLNCVAKKTEQEIAKIGKTIAEDVDKTIRDFPDAVLRPEDLLAFHSEPVFPQPHKRETASWLAIQKITKRGDQIGVHHFKPIKPLGCGDTGSVHLVELKGTGELFAMKAMKKSILVNHNKVHRASIERGIMSQLDHPFLPTLYASFQTPTHVCLVTDFFPGGELFNLLDKQPMKILKEEYARFYAAEVVICLEYLHCLGIIYRDLKPENILLQQDGHIVLTDFDLSFLTSCKPQILKHPLRANRRSRCQIPPMCVAEPVTGSNSFVGTEEYIAPEVITGGCHTSAMDWWALGILLYEMLYGRSPFKGKCRQRTFANILHKDLTFPSSIQVSLAARQLINALLQRDPISRLGSISGANEIKRHPFFRGISWPLIRWMSPPPLDATLQLPEKDPDT